MTRVFFAAGGRTVAVGDAVLSGALAEVLLQIYSSCVINSPPISNNGISVLSFIVSYVMFVKPS